MKLYCVFVFISIKIFLFQCNEDCSKTICNPRAGDLLIGRESFLSASSTCGLNQPERYCIVTSSDSEKKSKCDICFSQDPFQRFSSPNSHRIENIVSRLPRDPSRWWQSVNGVHNVSIEVSFESEFQMIYTQLRFKTYRPAAMYIERSKDYGRTWIKYAYFSDNCASDFPSIPDRKRSDINEILCTSEFSSIIPSEGGTVLFSPDTSERFSSDEFWNKKRNDMTALTNLRVQFVRLHTLGDWKIDDNPNIRNKYYYAISEWIIRGRCSCYGHAARCRPKEGQSKVIEMVYGVCECQHNTKGQHCEKCKDFYNDSPWLPAHSNSTNECRKCNCNNHSNSCHFNPVVYRQSGYKSGGVCDNCQHNTESKNCEKCKSGYYRNPVVPIQSKDTCLKCQCDSLGTKFPQLCIQETEPDRSSIAGNCICKENVDGDHCNECKIGFWNFNGDEEKGCIKCNCRMMGTFNNRGCDVASGRCFCKKHVTEDDCSSCKNGYFNLTESNPDGCSSCGCSNFGSLSSEECDKESGQCKCKPGYTGRTCNDIKPEWFVEKTNIKLKEDIKIELPPVSKSGYYNFIITMDTQQMQILDSYSISLIIDHAEKSSCPPYRDRMKLMKDTNHIVVPNKCLEKDLSIIIIVNVTEQPADKFLPPAIIDIIVIPILDVNSTKTRNILADCIKYKKSALPKHCEFLTTEISSKSVTKIDPRRCTCNVTGSVNNICDKIGGQCLCLLNVIGRKCDRCAPNTYGFDARGCKSCNCDLNGSLNSQCATDTGKCLCRSGVEGQFCDSCKSGYWNFPFCHPCSCNKMANSCDQKTGNCINCRGNSFGPSCQHCQNGFYGDPSQGISCEKCHCPGLSINKNNSIGCNLIFNTNAYFCHCKPGYNGRYCENCEQNYFGNPRIKDGTCQPCKCSDNINLNVAGSCDPRTGECTKCLYNTAGFNCEKCASGYFGSGVLRSCRKCVCNALGTDFKTGEMCHHETGKCACLPNVIGQECDQCQDNYYNISSKTGCSPCDCDYPSGAFNKSCNKLTGQCVCHFSRSGLKCNKCQDGHWGSPKTLIGCQICRCNALGSLHKQCDRNNGACKCKPGITGRYCDKCRKGTDGKMPNCTSCGDCWLQWDTSIENVAKSVNNINLTNLTNVASSKYPKEVKVLLLNIDKYLASIQSIVDYFPNNLHSAVNNLEKKLIELKNYFEDIKIVDWNDDKFALSNITKLINSARDIVSKSKIKDIEGASNEIQKSWTDIYKALNETKELFAKINNSSVILLNPNSFLYNMNMEDLIRKNEELGDLNSTLSKSLDAFNGITCNGKLGIPLLKCTDLCGNIGCQPNMCYRNVSIDPQCLQARSFFNAIVWDIDGKNNLDSNLGLVNTDNIRTKINGEYKKVMEEYNVISLLSDVANQSILTKYQESIKVLNELRKQLSESVSEKEFNTVIDKINNFESTIDYAETMKLQEEIMKRRQNSTNILNILGRSSKNRNECESLKASAIQAKKNVIYLLRSLSNLNNTNQLTEENTSGANRILSNVTDYYLVAAERNLEKIQERQKEVKHIQDVIEIQINRTLLMESMIEKKSSNISNSLTELENKQEKQLQFFKSLSKKIYDVETKKDSVVKESELSDNNFSKNLDTLQDKILKLGDKIKRNHQKLKDTKSLIEEKQSKLESLGKDIELKLIRIANLQERIYEKSEYHAKCLP